MDNALADLIRISKITGKDPALVQGGGGNTSVKTPDGKFLYIKASGTDLKNMNAHTGWCKLRLDSVLAVIKDKSIANLGIHTRESKVAKRLLFACVDKAAPGFRPSIEAHLHAMLGRCVIHLHPDAVLSFACARNGKAELEKLFRNSEFPLPPLWVPYAHPGFSLAKKIEKLVAHYQNRLGIKPAVLFLQKHGLLISADSPNAALRLMHCAINRCAGRLKKLKSPKTRPPSRKTITDIKLQIHNAIYHATGLQVPVNYFHDNEIAAFWRQKNAKNLLTPPALTPAEMIYTGGPPMWIEDCNPKKITRRLISLIKKGKNPIAAFLVKSVGLFVAAADTTAPVVRDIVKSSLCIRTNASRLGGILTLNKAQQDFIKRWEVDTSRKKLVNSNSSVV